MTINGIEAIRVPEVNPFPHLTGLPDNLTPLTDTEFALWQHKSHLPPIILERMHGEQTANSAVFSRFLDRTMQYHSRTQQKYPYKVAHYKRKLAFHALKFYAEILDKCDKCNDPNGIWFYPTQRGTIGGVGCEAGHNDIAIYHIKPPQKIEYREFVPGE